SGEPAHFTAETAPLLARTLKVQSRENAALRSRTAELEARLDGSEADAARASKAAREVEVKLQGELRGTREDLQAARKLLADSAAGLAVFRSKMADALTTYRAQRAWKVMLATRKLYTLLAREGAAASAKWLARFPFAGFGSLDAQELSFPDLLEDVP